MKTNTNFTVKKVHAIIMIITRGVFVRCTPADILIAYSVNTNAHEFTQTFIKCKNENVVCVAKLNSLMRLKF